MNHLRLALTDAVLYAAKLAGDSLPADLRADVAALKATTRDKNEPGRLQKMRMEERIARLFKRVFKKQRDAIVKAVEQRTARKADIDWLELGWDEDDQAELMFLLQLAGRDGVDLFGEQIQFDFDTTRTNAKVTEWAQKYAGKLIKEIDATSLEMVRKAVTAFTETEGMTLGDLMDMLPFDEQRALKIAVTEVTRSYAEGELEAGRQLAEEYPGLNFEKHWYTNEDDRVCPICGELSGMVIPVGEQFDIDALEEPIDGPPAHVNCVLPGQFTVVPGGAISGAKSFYVGDCVKVTLASGHNVSVTPNHKIATLMGWKSAKDIKLGDYVISHTDEIISEFDRVYPNYNHTPAIIEQIFGALVKAGGMTSARMPVSTEDFHGDGWGMNGNIDIVYPHGELRRTGYTSRRKEIVQGFFGFIHWAFCHSNRSAYSFFFRSLPAFTGSMTGRYLSNSFIFGHASPLDRFGFTLASDVNTRSNKSPANSPAISHKTLGQFILRYANRIQVQKVVNVDVFSYSGHVYDLQSRIELYSVNNIITHNCRCWMSVMTGD